MLEFSVQLYLYMPYIPYRYICTGFQYLTIFRVMRCPPVATHPFFVLTLHNHTSIESAQFADGSTSPTVWFDEYQRLIHKDKPLFPIGLYLSEVDTTDLATIGQSKFNMIMPYRAPANESVMDEIHKAGLHVMFSTKDSYFGGPNAYKTVITSREKEEGFVKGQVSRFKDHPALLGWYDCNLHCCTARTLSDTPIADVCTVLCALWCIRRYLNDELNVEWMADLVRKRNRPICCPLSAASR
eukprot:COSAG02_NODE_2670_length_8288_cov_6.629792_2_plen_241_part_00